MTKMKAERNENDDESGKKMAESRIETHEIRLNSGIWVITYIASSAQIWWIAKEHETTVHIHRVFDSAGWWKKVCSRGADKCGTRSVAEQSSVIVAIRNDIN